MKARRIAVIGDGKMGQAIRQLAVDKSWTVTAVLGERENAGGNGITAKTLGAPEVAVEFTQPDAAIGNITACLRAGVPIVVGTTGWYERMPEVRALVDASGVGFLFGANFSIGVNLLLEIARTASAATQYGYTGQIFERHHVHKKDAPSGTAIAIQNAIRGACGQEMEITSFREGEVVGWHEVILDSPHDRIYLCHDAKSRRGFAEGAVRAAEWVVGKNGFFDFKDVWRQV